MLSLALSYYEHRCTLQAHSLKPFNTCDPKGCQHTQNTQHQYDDYYYYYSANPPTYSNIYFPETALLR